jgi:hypothetical protein
LRLSADLSLLPVKPPKAIQDDHDHFESIAIIPAADTGRPVNPTDCKLSL